MLRRFQLPLLMLLNLSSVGFSDEAVSERSILEQSIRQWIADWDSPSFAARTTASNQLRDAGSTAFPAIVDAVKVRSPEIVSRALALLKGSLHAEDAVLKEAARVSLNQIASGPNPSAARSARQILDDFDRPPPQISSWPAFGNQMNIAIAQRINMWTFNGSTTIEAFENNVKIKIQKDANGRIMVDITQKRQGLDWTQKFEAASPAELRKKHPLAYQAYQRYEPTLQQAQVAGLRQRLPPGIAPPMARNAPRRPQPAFGPQLPILPNDVELLRKQAAKDSAAQAMQLRLREAIEQRDLERQRANGAR